MNRENTDPILQSEMEENNLTRSAIKTESVREIATRYDVIKEEIGKYVIGNQELIRLILIGLLSGGHILIEGVPGTAKTTLAKIFAALSDFDLHRFQCAVDSLPADVIGLRIWNRDTMEFEIRKGPIFTNFLIIDEINRLPPKSQSAFIEALAEGQVTIDGITLPLAEPFVAMATQNPYESEGTFPLISAQKDRFLLSTEMSHLKGNDELKLIKLANSGKLLTNTNELPLLFSKEEILLARRLAEKVHVEERILEYIRDLVMSTREHNDISLGVSARGSLALLKGARSQALLEGRDYVIPDDVKAVAIPALSHRIQLTREAELSGISSQEIIEGILLDTEVL